MKNLADIFRAGRTDKETTHNYGAIYEWLLAPYRDRPIRLLEVGVCQFGGGCLLGLAEYLPQAEIWGIDNNLAPCCEAARSHPRIKLIEADAYNAAALFGAVGDDLFDVIIDDACHELPRQMLLLEFLDQMLAPGGFYCIEDCLTKDWLAQLPDFWALGLQQTIIDMSTPTQPDNTLIVWRKTP